MRKRLKSGETTVLLNVKVPVSWKAALERIADKSNPVSSLLRDAIRQFLKRNNVGVE